MNRTGLPHSDTHGSMLVCSSPWLFAAYHVLHRLLVPRHPPYALSNLTKNSRRNLVTRKNTTFYLVVKDLLRPAFAGLEFYLKLTALRQLLLFKWRRPGSNRRPIACKAIALPTELRPLILVGLSGVEPPTSSLSGTRSNQLS
jgi:hypothetical protein